MVIYLITLYIVSLALAYELQSTHAALLLGEQIAGPGKGAKYIQNAITPPASTNVGLVIYFSCLAVVGYGWYRFGWLAGLASIPALLFGSGINRLLGLVPRSDSDHFQRIIIGSMMRRYADYQKSRDIVRADAMADLLDRAGFPLSELAPFSRSHHIERRQRVPGEEEQEDAPDSVQGPRRDAPIRPTTQAANGLLSPQGVHATGVPISHDSERDELMHKPFTAALVRRAQDFEEEVESELASVVGGRQPTESAKALKDIVASGAVVVAFRITTEAAQTANRTAIFLPDAPLPAYASAVVAYSCFVLACVQGHIKQEGIDLEFKELVINTTNLFFFGFPDEERANNAFAGFTAFQNLMRADGEELKKWYDALAKLVPLYILQRTTSDPELKKLNLIPSFGNMLLNLVRAAE